MKLQRVPHVRGISGFTIIETLIFAAVLTIGLLALTATSLTVHSLRRAVDERNTARAAMQSMVEDMRRNAFVLSANPDDWALDYLQMYGAGGSFGDTFAVPGLSPQPGDPEVGSITIFTDETRTDEELGLNLGMPIDLDNDGVIDNPDVSLTAQMLPVLVRVAWRGVTGNLQMRQEFFVLSY